MRRTILAAALTALTLGSPACSFSLDFPQCRNKDDCDKGDDGPVQTCAENHRCVDATDLPCESNEACAADFGDDFVCGVDKTCVNALSAECRAVHWPSDTSRDKVVFVGSIIPVNPPYDAITVPLQNAIDLAVGDFNTTTELQGGRKVAWVECDDGGRPDKAVDAAKHLTGTLGAPAILGPVFSEAVLKIAQDVTIPADTFVITPTASSEQITTLNDKNLVWRTVPSDVYQTSALRDYILALDPLPASLVILAKDDAYGNGILAGLVDPVGVLPKVGAFRYPDPTSFATGEELLASYGAIIGQVFGTAPDTILIIGTSEAANLIAGYIQAWNLQNPPPPLPRIILSHGAVPTMELAVEQFSSPDQMALREALISLVKATSPIIQDPNNFAGFNIRYSIRFANLEPLTTASLSYDAALVTMLAMATVKGDEAITGAKIAAGMTSLVDKAGVKVSFGGNDVAFIKTARDTLVAGATVDLEGVSGPLDFDLATGEVRANLIGWDLVAKDGTTDVPVIHQDQIYILNPEPSVDGVWMDLP
ncbi:MAG: ABC transporter substrate-binding protein [Nannocystaceae bacterium]